MPETSTPTTPLSSWTMPKPYGSGALFIEFILFQSYIMCIKFIFNISKNWQNKKMQFTIISNILFLLFFLFLLNNQTWSVNYCKYYKLDPRRLKKQVLKNKLDEENVAYQENTNRINLASQLQIHIFNKNNQIQPIMGL